MELLGKLCLVVMLSVNVILEVAGICRREKGNWEEFGKEIN